MPKVSKQSTPGIDQGGLGREWRGQLGGYTLSFVETAADVDLTPLLQGLPNDQCPSPHWGYVTKGRMWFLVDGREESYGPGDAYYVPPGHTPVHYAGAEIVEFSPTDQLGETIPVVMANVQAAGATSSVRDPGQSASRR